MKFALHFGNLTFPDPEGARRLVRLAEAAGFDSVFAVEHVVFPDNYASVYPYAPGGRLPGGPSTKFPDPLIWLAYVASVTTRICAIPLLRSLFCMRRGWRAKLGSR